jgi:hypothetical protein
MSTSTNAALVTFGACTVGTPTITHFGIGRASAGAGELITSAALTASLAVSPGITPEFAIGALSVSGLLNLLKLVFTNTTWANVGDATGLVGSSVAGSLYVSLHTASPAAGDQTTSETSYTGYARVAVARSGAGWTVS